MSAETSVRARVFAKELRASSILLVLGVVGIVPGQAPAASPDEIKLSRAEWEVVRTSGEAGTSSVEWLKRREGLDTAKLSISGKAPEELTLVSRKTLRGEFDVEVEVFVPQLAGAPGSVLRTSLGVAQSEDHFRRRAYLIFHEARNEDVVFVRHRLGATFVNAGREQPLPHLPAGSSKSMTFRFQRHKGQLTASFLRVVPRNPLLPDRTGAVQVPQLLWVDVARFKKSSDEPLHLLLAISNTAEKKPSVFSAHTALFSKLWFTIGHAPKP